MNKVRTVALSGAVLLALYGCGKSEAPPAPKAAAAEETIVKIGHAAPLTGGIAHLGKDNENGARLAIDEANARNLSIDGKKVKFELLAEDDEEKPDRGPIIAQKFIDAKVAGVVGHLNSGVSIPASTVYAQAGIPMVTGSSTNPKLTEQGLKTVFRTVGRDDQQGPAIASYLAAEYKPKLVAIIDDATAYGEGLGNEVEKTLSAAGIKVLPREKGSKDTRDWKAVLTKIKGKKPDAVFYGGMDATAGPLLKQGRELGIKVVFAFGDGACTNTMKDLAGDAALTLFVLQDLVGHLTTVNIHFPGEFERDADPIALDRRNADDAQRRCRVSDHDFFSLSAGDHEHRKSLLPAPRRPGRPFCQPLGLATVPCGLPALCGISTARRASVAKRIGFTYPPC